MEWGEFALKSDRIALGIETSGRRNRINLLPNRAADGIGNGPAKRLGESPDKVGGDLRHMRPGKWRSRDDLIGAQRRRHCHHREDVPCSGHQKTFRSLCAAASGRQADHQLYAPGGRRFSPAFDPRKNDGCQPSLLVLREREEASETTTECVQRLSAHLDTGPGQR